MSEGLTNWSGDGLFPSEILEREQRGSQFGNVGYRQDGLVIGMGWKRCRLFLPKPIK